MPTSLEDVFKHAWDEWNRGDYNKLGERFDVNIIMKKLDDPGSVVGIGNAFVYLNENQKPKKPQFTAGNVEKPITWANGTVAQISGTAKYLDKQGDPKATPVRFTFTFTRASEKEEWLIINLFQARSE